MGGYDIEALTTELFLPSAGTLCTLPLLPYVRVYHTVDNNIICGGDQTYDTCLRWNPDIGFWEEMLTLDMERSGHVSWTPSTGIGTYLMGGFYSSTTTTLITPEGSQEQSFPLKYETS